LSIGDCNTTDSYYSFDIQKTYPAGRSDIAASGGTATFTVKLITTTNGTPDAGVLVDLDTGYPSVTSSPTEQVSQSHEQERARIQ